MFLELAEESAELLTAPERVAFMGNSAALLDAGVLSGGDFLGVLRSFTDDEEPEVVSTVISGINRVSDQLVPPEGSDLFAVFLRDSLRPAVDRFGLDLRSGEAEAVSLFRPRLFRLLGDTGRDADVRRRATTLAELVSGRRVGGGSVSGRLGAPGRRDRGRHGDCSRRSRARFEAAETPVERGRFLGALGYFDDSEIQVVALDYNLSGTVRPTELFTIPGSIARTEEGGDRAFNWLVDSWDDLAPRLPKMVLSFMPLFAGGCSEERLATADEFFSDEAHQVDGTLNNLAKVTEQVTDCARLREREGPSVLRFLKEEPEVAKPDERG